jgi:uncharacterized repeat protein (TIGR01451 family)
VVVVDTLPAGIDFISSDPICGYDGVTREVTCSIGNLAFGAVQNLTINAVASQPGDNENIATIGGDDLDLDLGNNTSSLTTHVTQADLEIVKSAPAVSTIGASLVYTLDVTNHGPSASTNVVVIDTLPANVTLDSASAGCFYDGDVSVTCALGAVDPTTTISINITVIPTVDASQLALENTASVSGDVHDSDLSNNADSATTTITEANLNLVKSGPDSVTVGEQIEYTLSIRNKGPSVATGVVLTDTLPASVSFVSASPGCVENGGIVVCDVGSIPVDTNAFATIFVVANQPGSTVNVAETWGFDYDKDPDSNGAIFTTTVTAADLSVVKTAPASATVNGPFDYNISVSNSGPSTANSVVLVDTLPPTVVFNSGSAIVYFGEGFIYSIYLENDPSFRNSTASIPITAI